MSLSESSVILSEHSERRTSLQQTPKDPSAAPQDDRASCHIEVCVPVFLKKTLTYNVSGCVQVGQVVEISIKDKTYLGVVWEIHKTHRTGFKVKDVLRVHDITLPKTCLDFVKWVAGYTMTPVGMILKMMLPVKNIRHPESAVDLAKVDRHDDVLKLSQQQTQALQTIEQHLYKKPILLDGVTGSGKTEVYLALCQKLLAKNKQILILLPEIGLTEQVIERIAKNLNIKPFVWHSKITPAKKEKIFINAVAGVPGIYIGARSALFLPYKNLDLIVVDEEHDGSYKQDEKIMYHARDMAVVRANIEKIGILLCSATPSIETVVNVQNGKYEAVKLGSRYGKSALPDIELVDMKDTKDFMSSRLKELIQKGLDQKEQTLLFMNRRGYAPILLCKSCGYKKNCPFCSTHLVLHKAQNKIMCHYCGFNEDYNEPKCKNCPHIELEPFGLGIERICDEVEKIFPHARVLCVASDQITSASKLNEVRRKILDHEVDIIVGTQILAKGHHFPSLTLVGVLDADMGLHGIDLRSTEKTYQMLHQVAGRCGREEKKGHVVIQTYSADHPAIMALAAHDRDAFEEYEIEDRKLSSMPPFSQLATITLSGKNFQKVKETIFKLYEACPVNSDIKAFKPAPAPIRRLKMMFRYRILVHSNHPSPHALQQFIHGWLSKQTIPGSLKLLIDINPWNFM
ncbi:MAG: primosomal protein N' [Alphaproteobacteria bacterium]|nr:MAG: primosomal protein N' [Alphaproteobacteria bacterium]